MIKTIKFHDPDKMENLPEEVVEYMGYEFGVKSLKGKVFEFTPGLNIIIGANGCGKTSMLNVIKDIMFCKNKVYSDIKNENYAVLTIEGMFERGIWHLTEMESDYRALLFSLRMADELRTREQDNVMNFLQTYESYHSSSGENVLNSFHLLGKELVSFQGEKMKELSFKKEVLDKLPELLERHGDMETIIQNYYRRNRISEKGEEQNHSGITIVMDEPDHGLDVINLQSVFGLIENWVDIGKAQIIMSCHNPLLIQKFRKQEWCNVIELTEGYMSKIEEWMA